MLCGLLKDIDLFIVHLDTQLALARNVKAHTLDYEYLVVALGLEHTD